MGRVLRVLARVAVVRFFAFAFFFIPVTKKT
jgi:hypothetical protein